MHILAHRGWCSGQHSQLKARRCKVYINPAKEYTVHIGGTVSLDAKSDSTLGNIQRQVTINYCFIGQQSLRVSAVILSRSARPGPIAVGQPARLRPMGKYRTGPAPMAEHNQVINGHLYYLIPAKSKGLGPSVLWILKLGVYKMVS